MQVYIGIDWSETKHDVVWMNAKGEVLAQLVIEHSQTGFQKLDATCERLGLKMEEVMVGLETAHNLLIDHLWSHGYRQVYVLPPSVVKSNQGRYGSSGSMNDPKAAQLIADILRTDRGRLQPWHPDSLLTRQMRAKVSLVLFLTKEVTRLSNRLRAVLLRYYPAALEIFAGGLASQITLTWIEAYPTPQAAAQVDLKAFQAFAQEQGYPKTQVAKCYTRLQGTFPPTPLATVQIYQSEAVTLARLLREVYRTELCERRELFRLFEQHPHYPIFHSLPGTGEFLGPALCAKFGDDRDRFPQAASVQALAGTCPVTRQSGKGRRIVFRKGCDREWRYICSQWAKTLLSNQASALASAYFAKVQRRNPSPNHAYRCLANRWMSIAWKLWHSQTVYDEAYHFEQVSARAKPHK